MQIYTRVSGGMCSVMWLPLPSNLARCSCGKLGGRAVPGAPMALPRSPLGEGRCVPPLAPPELCRTSVSMRSKKESSALMLYNVFSSKWFGFSFPSSSLTLSNYYYYFFFILALPLSSSALTARNGASVALVGCRNGSAFPFPAAALSQSGRALLPDARSARAASASVLRPVRGASSKLLHCRFSFDVQS